MDTQKRSKILNDPDYIHSKRYNNSLNELLKRHPEGVSDQIIAKVLMMSVDEVERINNQIIEKIRQNLKIT